MKEKIYMKKKLFERMILSTVNRLLHKKVTFQKKKKKKKKTIVYVKVNLM